MEKLIEEHSRQMARIEGGLAAIAEIWRSVSEAELLQFDPVALHKARIMMHEANAMLCNAKAFHCEADLLANEYAGQPMPESGGR